MLIPQNCRGPPTSRRGRDEANRRAQVEQEEEGRGVSRRRHGWRHCLFTRCGRRRPARPGRTCGRGWRCAASGGEKRGGTGVLPACRPEEGGRTRRGGEAEEGQGEEEPEEGERWRGGRVAEEGEEEGQGCCSGRNGGGRRGEAAKGEEGAHAKEGEEGGGGGGSSGVSACGGAGEVTEENGACSS